MNYQGIILSDAMNMAAIEQGQGLIVDTLAAAAAGIDLLMLLDDMKVQQEQYRALVQATQRGLLPKEKMLAAADRVLALKSWLAQSQQPSLDKVGCAEHRQLASEVAIRSLTLVRDDAGLLPLKLTPEARVALVVPRPADLTPADTSSYATITLADELRQFHPAVDGFVISHQPTDADRTRLLQQLVGYDLILMGTLNACVYAEQASLVNELLALGLPTVLVALRLPYDLRVFPAAPTYVCTYSILPASMRALAQAVFGQVSFQGRLPVAIPDLYEIGHRL